MPPALTIARDKLQTIATALDAIKPPQVTAREAIAELASTIRAARGRGCSDRDILAVLATEGLPMSASTLRSHLSEAAPRGRPPRKSAALAAAKALAAASTAVGGTTTGTSHSEVPAAATPLEAEVEKIPHLL